MIESLIKILKSWEINFKDFTAQLILGLAVLLIFYIIARLTRQVAYKINSQALKKHKDLQTILSKIIYYFIMLMGYYLFLQTIGLEQYFVKILAGAGIVGIIAGFALKDIASNAFSGLLLFIEKPYINNDWIQIDGHYGKVIKVGLLTTSMTNKTGQIIYISNQLIYSGVFINYSDKGTRGVRLKTDLLDFFDMEKIKDLLSEKLKTLPQYVAREDIDIAVSSISPNGDFTIEILFWVNFNSEKDYLKTLSDTLVIVKQCGIDNNIKMVNTTWLSDEDNNSSAGMYGNGD